MKKSHKHKDVQTKATQTDIEATMPVIFYMGNDGDDDSDYVPKKRTKKTEYCFKEDEDYFKKLKMDKKKQIRALEKEIETHNKSSSIPLRFKILESNMDISLKALAITKLDHLNNFDPSSGEYYKTFTYIENMCKLPIGKFKELSIKPDISGFLENTQKKLDEKVYGHHDAKQHIIRLLAKWISNPNGAGLVIGIQGNPGCGKTLLCKDGICELLGLPFGFVGLGGASDGSFLVGHSFTYESSRWGIIADILMKAGCSNPILYFDELDKISTTRHGEEIMNILIHLTDGVQNSRFHDKYFADVNLDLSRCLIVFSYNNEDLINPILKDRMVTVHTKGYVIKDKLHIAKFHMIPEILKNFGFNNSDLGFTDEILTYIIGKCQEEEGVRNFRRGLEEIESFEFVATVK